MQALTLSAAASTRFERDPGRGVDAIGLRRGVDATRPGGRGVDAKIDPRGRATSGIDLIASASAAEASTEKPFITCS